MTDFHESLPPDERLVFGPPAEQLHAAVSSLFNDTQELPSTPVTLADLSGDQLEVSVIQTTVEEGKVGLRGLVHRIRSKFSPKTPAGDPYSYEVTWKPLDSPEQTKLWIFNNTLGVSVMGEMETTTPEGTLTASIAGSNLTEIVSTVQEKVETSERFSAASIIESRQMGACARIQGEEALSVYASLVPALQKIFDVADLAALPPHFYIEQDVIISDQSDDLPIHNFGALRAQYDNTLYVSITFAESPVRGRHGFSQAGDPFIVDIIKNMANAELSVSYRLSHHAPGEPLSRTDEAVALEPQTRARLHRAIARQLVPENLGRRL